MHSVYLFSFYSIAHDLLNSFQSHRNKVCIIDGEDYAASTTLPSKCALSKIFPSKMYPMSVLPIP